MRVDAKNFADKIAGQPLRRFFKQPVGTGLTCGLNSKEHQEDDSRVQGCLWGRMASCAAVGNRRPSSEFVSMPLWRTPPGVKSTVVSTLRSGPHGIDDFSETD
jgi:hypothetical protein